MCLPWWVSFLYCLWNLQASRMASPGVTPYLLWSSFDAVFTSWPEAFVWCRWQCFAMSWTSLCQSLNPPHRTAIVSTLTVFHHQKTRIISLMLIILLRCASICFVLQFECLVKRHSAAAMHRPSMILSEPRRGLRSPVMPFCRQLWMWSVISTFDVIFNFNVKIDIFDLIVFPGVVFVNVLDPTWSSMKSFLLLLQTYQDVRNWITEDSVSFAVPNSHVLCSNDGQVTISVPHAHGILRGHLLLS